MRQYICTICGYIYDEAAGVPERGITPGTEWENVPSDWTCPLCGAAKVAFDEKAEVKSEPSMAPDTQEMHHEAMREMASGELSVLCSNLSKGCEKQYLQEEAKLFTILSEYFNSQNHAAENETIEALLSHVQRDLDNYENAKRISASMADRGALRALVWSEKVTKILTSLLRRYEKQKEKLLENKNVYVCEVCGFVYIGEAPPAVCPVCKVPEVKIKKIEKEAV
jgi:rubredoxin